MSPTRHDIDLRLVVDNTRGEPVAPPGADDLVRDVALTVRRSAEGYEIVAFGDGFFPPEVFPTGARGRLSLDEPSLDEAVFNLRAVWQRHAIEHAVPVAGVGRRRFPFSDHWHVSTDDDELREATLRKLARAGHDLYRFLYRNADAAGRHLFDHLAAAHRQQELVMVVESDDFFVPWRMLYLPLRPDEATGNDRSSQIEGFWGHRHVLEQRFRQYRRRARVELKDGKLAVGINVDEKLDTEDPERAPCVKPILDYFAAIPAADPDVRTKKESLREAIERGLPDALLYFGCHGRVQGSPAQRNLLPPSLTLTDGEPITPTEFETWLLDRFPNFPIVIINACQGGQMSSAFYRAFAPKFMEWEANCVLGAQTDLPAAFSAEFARRLFDGFFAGERRLGSLLRDLTRDFYHRHGNFMGLIYSLYHGLNTLLSERILAAKSGEVCDDEWHAAGE